MDEDEMLRRALQESLQISEQEERQRREEQRREEEREAELLRQSEQDAQRRQRQQQTAEDDEEEMMRRAIEESERAEEERIRRQREELQRLDASFGSRSTNTPTRAAPQLAAPLRLAAALRTPPANRYRNRDTGHRHPPRNNPQASPARTPAPAQAPRERRNHQSNNPPRSPAPQSTTQPALQRSTQPARRPERARRRRSRHEVPTVLEDPGHYDLEDVLRMSLQDTSAAPPEEDGFNRDELAAAIAESANQQRDEEQEAIDRNQGIPTYKEACKAPIYRAPKGAKYKFQGPSKAELEGGFTMEIVGEMDLATALKIANKNVKVKRKK